MEVDSHIIAAEPGYRDTIRDRGVASFLQHPYGGPRGWHRKTMWERADWHLTDFGSHYVSLKVRGQWRIGHCRYHNGGINLVVAEIGLCNFSEVTAVDFAWSDDIENPAEEPCLEAS